MKKHYKHISLSPIGINLPVSENWFGESCVFSQDYNRTNKNLSCT